MAKYQQYAEYKDSGVEWLGEIPKDWGVTHLKFVASIVGRIGFRGYTVDDIVNEGQGAIVLSPSNVRDDQFSLEKKSYLSWAKYFESPEIMVEENDILLVKTGSTFGKSTIVREVGEPMTINPQMVLIKKSSIDSRFLSYLFNSSLIKAKIEVSNTGSGMPTMTQENINNFPIPLPATKSDIKIANFLDHETAQIDTLIEKQQTLIQLLKEKRQAVISHAVTKGLNPDAPMKDSGVEWLGEVPEHWEITKVGWVLNYLSYGFTNPMPTSDEGPYMLTATDINFNEINFEQARKTTNDAYENFITSKSKPEQGDLLLTKDGTLGRVAVFNSTYKTCISQSIALLRPNKKYVLSYFMEAALASSKYQKKMIFDAGGTTIKHIYISILAKMNLALPDIDEQLEITNYLNSKIDKFDALILKAQQAIQLMQERRTALISAAVTGKIDVRGWVAPESR